MTPDSKPVAAVVVHWNQGEACSETIAKLRSEQLICSVIVVDNGSRESELAQVKAAAPDQLLELGSNRGFGPATNAGWQHWLDNESTPYCLTLPHDAFAAPGAVAEMVAILQARPEIGLLSADVGDNMLPVVDSKFGPIFKPQDAGDGFQACAYPHGTMFVARRECLSQIGLYDERFFTYCEEADLGIRARAAGWSVGMAVGSRVFNPRVSTPRPVAGYLMERNTLLLVGKHFGSWSVAVRSGLAILQLAQGLVRPSKRNEYWSTKGRVLALRDAALRRFGPPPRSLSSSTKL